MVLRTRPRSQVALAYGVFCLSIACWSASFFVWQMMKTPVDGLCALRWVLFFGMWPLQSFVYFVFVFVGMNRRRQTFLLVALFITLIFAYLNFKGILFPSVEERHGLGYWGNITGWFSLY